MRSIFDAEMKCPQCGWFGTVRTCGDVEHDDGELDCPICHSAVIDASVEVKREHDKTKAIAARAFALPVEQMRYYNELTNRQADAVDQSWGIVPNRGEYVYAVKRDGELVWDRKRIAQLLRLN